MCKPGSVGSFIHIFTGFNSAVREVIFPGTEFAALIVHAKIFKIMLNRGYENLQIMIYQHCLYLPYKPLQVLVQLHQLLT